MPLNVQIYDTADAFDTLSSEWSALLGRAATNTLFLTREFQANWWQHFGAEGGLRLVVVRDDAGALAGIVPLYAEPPVDGRVALRLIGGVEVADYCDIIAPRGSEETVIAAAFDALCTRDNWHVLDLRNLPAASATRTLMAAQATARGFSAEERVEEVCPVITLPETFDAYLETLDKKQRHEVRRKLRKAHAEAEINWYVTGATHDLDQALSDFIDLHQKSQQNKDSFMTPAMQAYFRDLARIMLAAGWLELSFIEVNGQRAATYFSFVYDKQTLLYNSGYDPQAYAALSPGIVLLSHLIEHSIEQKRTHFDFLQGSETYKYRMGAVDTHVHMLTVSR
ncbi:MAG: GNAT family N-acetyltransferase [Chloroflexi bacterium]|nr:GNAT family N-acetyltransferase [Chloroflexota bacterium]